MATHSNILAWRILDRGAWQTTIHGATKESDTTQGLNNNKGLLHLLFVYNKVRTLPMTGSTPQLSWEPTTHNPCIVWVACMLCHFSRVRLFATPRTQPGRLLCPWNSPGKNTPGDLPDPEVEPASLMPPALVGRFFTTSATPVFLPGESMDRAAWWATVHGVAKSWTQLSDYTQHTGKPYGYSINIYE